MDLNGKHVFVSKQQGIGDVVLTTSLLYALKQKYPLVHITYMVFPNALQAVTDLPFIDRVFVYDKKKDSVLKLWHELRAADVALLLDLQYRPALLACLAGVPVRVGIKHKRGFWLNKALAWESWLDHTYEPSAQARLVHKLMGIELDQKDLAKPFFSEPATHDIERIRFLFSEKGWSIDRPFIVASPITAFAFKNWPQDRWAAMSKTIYDRHGIPTVLVGTATEQLDYAGNGIINLTGETNLLQMAAVIRQASLVVNSCSLPVHIAAAFGVPTIVLYGYSDPARWAPRQRCSIIQSDLPCCPCDGHYSQPCKWEKPLCMEAITVEQVVGAVEQQLLFDTK